MRDCIKLKKSNCKNCYKCIRVCPVKSILFDNNQAHIIDEDCILCGRCVVNCPQNAKIVRDDTEAVKEWIKGGKKVVASLAPSFKAKFIDTAYEDVKAQLLKLGFFDVEETSVGATIVKNQYEALLKENKNDVIISSCCPSVNLLIEKYYPEATKFLAKVKTPMIVHGQILKEKYPDCLVCFIGPCIAKKHEADEYPGIIDSAITFDELSNWLLDEKIEIVASKTRQTKGGKARLFPIAGGIIDSFNHLEDDIDYIAVDGITNCKQAIEDVLNGNITNCFIEMSSCLNSCIGGPIMGKEKETPIRDIISVKESAGKSDFVTPNVPYDLIKKNFSCKKIYKEKPSEQQITEILSKMGKVRKEDELNCGSCGYNTCREKAVAIFQGKANLLMCLPFLKEKAESFSNNIVNNTPNGLMVLNDNLEIQLINKAFCNILGVNNQKLIMNWNIERLMSPVLFKQVKESKDDIRNKQIYLPDYNKYINVSIIYDNNYHIIMVIARDVTSEVLANIKKENTSKATIDITDKVIEKQMRVVQEIASLLGETTAETKVALTKLKESLKDE